MYKMRLISIPLLAAMILLFASAGSVWAVPPIPSSFYGEIHVQVGDNPPSAGDTVEAFVPDVTGAAATATITTYSGHLVYSIDVPGDDADTSGKDGGAEGDAITFVINGRLVATATWHSGTNVNLDFHPPDAVVTNTGPVNEGTPVTIDASTSLDWGSDISTYAFDCGNDGAYEIGPQPGATAQCTFADNGTYPVGVRLTDLQGGVGTDSTTVTVDNADPVVEAGIDQTVNEGDTVNLDPATFSDAGTDDTHAATIDWGDGSPAEAGTVDQNNDTVSGSHLYADDGIYTVTVTVTDDDGGSHSDTLTVTVDNADPVVEAGSDQTVNEGDSVNLDPATFSDAGTGDTHAATIDWGDGSPAEAGTVDQNNDTVSGSHLYVDDGIYTVTVTVTDDDGGSHSDTLTVTVDNADPVVEAGSDQTVDEGDTVNLDPATFSDASTDDTHTATIDWGDGSPAEAGTVDQDNDTVSGSHLYVDDGTYTVTVTVTDDDGRSHSDTLTVTVNNADPVVEAGIDRTGDEGDTVNLDPATFSDIGTGDTHAATIDWGDGSPAEAGTVDQNNDTVSGSHLYADDGTYTVTVTVTDDDGGSHSDTLTVTVDNADPVVEAGSDQTVNEGDTVNLDPATFSDAGTGDTHAATIDWGDGSPAEAGTVDQDNDTVSGSHLYADDGIYTVTVTVTDDDGGSHSDTLTVTVDNADPVVEAGSDQTVDEGDTVNLDPATFSDASTDDTHTATIDWGDGSPAEAGTVDQDNDTVSGSHLYVDDGIYTVTVTVTDDDGGSHSDTLTVTVNNVVPVVEAGIDQTVDEGDTVNLDPATFSDIGTGDTHTATIDWGDGSPAEAGTVDQNNDTVSGSHLYADDGTCTVTVTVNDDDGGSHSDTLVITVNEVPPTNVDAGGPYNGTAGQSIALNGSATCASVDGCTYAWDLDDDGHYDDATGDSPTYTWNAVGDYTIGLQVTDDDGNSATDTADVHISGATHSIGLEVGWNLVSFRLQPVDTDIAAVLSSIDGNYDLVYAWDATGAHSGSGNWQKYDNIPMSTDTLLTLDETRGFWIHMTAADTLDVVGSVPQTTDIALLDDVGSWNLVGYPSEANSTLPDALEDHGVGTDFSLIYAFHANDPADPWKLFDRTGPDWVNDLTELSPGWGYWVKVSADHTWSVDS